MEGMLGTLGTPGVDGVSGVDTGGGFDWSWNWFA